MTIAGRAGPGVIVSVVCCVAGFGLAIVAEASGADRRDLRLGLAGLIASLLIGTFWVVLVFAAWTGS